MSIWYSAWSSIRYADPLVVAWGNQWMDPCMRGARSKATSQDVTFEVALLSTLQSARQEEKPITFYNIAHGGQNERWLHAIEAPTLEFEAFYNADLGSLN